MFLINSFIYSSAPPVETEFKITIDTTQPGSASDTFILRLWNGTTNMTVYWGDGNSDVITTYNQTELTHVYASSGTYQISCDGSFVGTEYYGGDKLKIMSIDNWGSNVFGKMLYSFTGCSNMVGNYTDVPNTSNVASMANMFRGCTNFNSDVSFDTSNVTSMANMFDGCTNFNQPISFDTSSATSSGLTYLFSGCTNFDQPISFDTSNVTKLTAMFRYCSSLNSTITFSDTSNVTDIASMFNGCTNFNQPISFDTSSVSIMYQAFYGSTNFNQDVSGFNISSLTNATGMLQNTAFSTTNYDLLLPAWDAYGTSSVPFHAGTAQYNTGAPATARSNMISRGWTITDGGAV
jgi:surface protein